MRLGEPQKYLLIVIKTLFTLGLHAITERQISNGISKQLSISQFMNCSITPIAREISKIETTDLLVKFQSIQHGVW